MHRVHPGEHVDANPNPQVRAAGMPDRFSSERKRTRSTPSCVYLAILLCVAAVSVTAQPVPISVVVRSGQQAPGLPVGVTFNPIDFAFGFGYLNNTGHVAFLAFIQGPGIAAGNDRGVWVGRPRSLAVAAREGDPAPDLPDGVVYRTLNETPSLSGDGAVAFRADLGGVGVTFENDRALFGGLAGAVRLAARLGGPAPGGPIDTYGGFTGSSINSFHQLAFGGVTGAGVETIWFGAPGSIHRSTSVGDGADDVERGSYTDLDLGGAIPVALNGAGQIVFRGTITPDPPFGANVLYGGLPLTPHLIARTDAGVPDAPGQFVGFGAFVISDRGLAAFTANAIREGGVARLCIFREIIGARESLDEVAVDGAWAPGTGATFNATGGLNGNFVPRLNNANGVAFRSGLAGAGVNAANDVGIWGHNDNGSLSLLAREGAPLRAAGPDVSIGAINNTPPALNGANRIAFRATLAGPAVNAANDDVIIAANTLGDLVLAAREGQAVEVAPGVVRTFMNFGPIVGPGTQDGASTSWNDHCQLLFRAELNDGSVGLFIADVNASCRARISVPPAPTAVAPGGDAEFTVTAVGPETATEGWLSLCSTVAEPTALCYKWQKDGVDLTDGATGAGSSISGANSPTLRIRGCCSADVGAYRVAVTTLCGSTLSPAAFLSLNLGSLTLTSVTATHVNLAWSGAPCVRLQSAADLTPPAEWADVSGTAGESSASVPRSGPVTFFRLVSF